MASHKKKYSDEALVRAWMSEPSREAIARKLGVSASSITQREKSLRASGVKLPARPAGKPKVDVDGLNAIIFAAQAAQAPAD